MPWVITGNKGCIFLLSLNITMFNCFCYLLLKIKKIQNVLPYSALLCWGLYVLWIMRACGIANIHGCYNTGLVDRIQQIDKVLSIGRYPVYVSSWGSPEFRYLYEFGVLKERAAKDGYPENFIFLKRDKHCLGQKKINYRLLNAQLLDGLPEGTIVYSMNPATDSIPPSYYEFDQCLFVKRKKADMSENK